MSAFCIVAFRQTDAESSALFIAALEVKRASEVILDDLPDDEQADTDALVLCGIKGLEYVGPLTLGDTNSMICHVDQQGCLLPGYVDRDQAALTGAAPGFGVSFDTVADKVKYYLTEADGVSFVGQPRFHRRIGLYLDINFSLLGSV